MPVISFHCTSCGATLRVDAAKAGLTGKCKGCGQPITVPAALPEMPTATPKPSTTKPLPAPLAPTEEYKPPAETAAPTPTRSADEVGRKTRKRRPPAEEEPDVAQAPPPRPADESAAWRKVNLGLLLLLVTIAINVIWGGATTIGCGILLSAPQAVPGIATTNSLMVLLVFPLVFSLLLHAGTAAGCVLCCCVPARHVSKTLPMAAMVLALLVMGSSIGGLVLGWQSYQRATAAASYLESLQNKIKSGEAPESPPDFLKQLEEDLRRARLSQLLGELERLLSAAQSLVFLFFLVQLARALDNREIAANCESLLKLTAGLVVAGFVMTILNTALIGLMFGYPGMAMRMVRVFSFVAVPGYIVGFISLGQRIWFAVVLFRVRDLVNMKTHRRKKRKRPAEETKG